MKFSDMQLVPVPSEDGSLVTYSACISPLVGKICVNVELDPWGDFFSVSNKNKILSCTNCDIRMLPFPLLLITLLFGLPKQPYQSSWNQMADFVWMTTQFLRFWLLFLA